MQERRRAALQLGWSEKASLRRRCMSGDRSLPLKIALSLLKSQNSFSMELPPKYLTFLITSFILHLLLLISLLYLFQFRGIVKCLICARV